jgi:O-antigen ligase
MSLPLIPKNMSALQCASTAAAFLLPGLALVLQSGYSYGAALLAIGALASLHRWPRARHDAGTWWLFASMLVMGVLWITLADPAERTGQWDRPAKFVLAAMCLLFATAYPPKAKAMYGGLIVGCIGAGAVAMWQVHVEGAPRASGFPTQRTNAIQWGNLALLLGVMLLLQAIALRKRFGWPGKLLAVVGVLAALDASVLSQSRGGWLALLAAIPLGLVLLYQIKPRALGKAVIGLLVLLAVVSAMNYRVLAQRMHLMEKEVVVYDTQRDASSSVGQRFEHWRFAWDMTKERPLLGWGMGRYMAEKEARVAAGRYHPAIVEYKFVHNEVLDVLVKRGIVGLLALLAFYAIPIWLFWPTRERMACHADARVRAQVLALRLAGLSIPVLYIGFGLTQVFFAHNSGIMFYLFMTTLCWSALLGLERGDCAQGQPSRIGAAQP